MRRIPLIKRLCRVRCIFGVSCEEEAWKFPRPPEHSRHCEGYLGIISFVMIVRQSSPGCHWTFKYNTRGVEEKPRKPNKTV